LLLVLQILISTTVLVYVKNFKCKGMQCTHDVSLPFPAKQLKTRMYVSQGSVETLCMVRLKRLYYVVVVANLIRKICTKLY